MVAIVSGNQLGLSLSSLQTLGQQGALGTAEQGRSGEKGYVNVATGNLVLQRQDDYLAAVGVDAALLRTYNSQGLMNDDNGDNWLTGPGVRRVVVASGQPGTADSTVLRTDSDGAQASYTWQAARAAYVGTAGSGAHDTVQLVGTTLVWTDGDTGQIERYDGATGRLLETQDRESGKLVSYQYNSNGTLAAVVVANDGSTASETVYLDYTGNLLQGIRIVAGGQTSSRVRYTYDELNRLSTVRIDLTPGNQSDAQFYTTTYSYDGTSRRVTKAVDTAGTPAAVVSTLTLGYVQTTPGEYRVQSVSNGVDPATTYAYDLAQRVTTVTNGQGQATRYAYDASGQLTRITHPPVGGVSPSMGFAYNAKGDLVRTTDATGRAVDMAYDDNGNQVLQRDTAGNTIARTFDARNRLLTESVYATADPDGAGMATPSGAMTTRYVYEAAASNRLRFVVTPQGRVTEYLYNSLGDRTSVIRYASSDVFAVAGLADSAVPAETAVRDWTLTRRATSQRTDFTYDARGQLMYEDQYGSVDTAGLGVAASRVRTLYAYDSAGRLLKTVQGTGSAASTTSMTYDGLDRLLTRTDALQQGTPRTTATTYDDAANRTTVTLENLRNTISTYDKAGRLLSVEQRIGGAVMSPTDPNLGTTQYAYDKAGRLTMTQDPTGVRQWFLYDAAGQREAVIDGNGSITVTLRDAAGRPRLTVQYVTPVNVATLSNSPTLAEVTRTNNPNDRWTHYVYDAAGQLAATVDPQGYVTRNWYDGAARLVRTTRYANPVDTAILTTLAGQGTSPDLGALNLAASAQDRTVSYFYDADGLLRGTVDAENFLTERKYDGAGNLVEELRHSSAVNPSQVAAALGLALASAPTASQPGTVIGQAQYIYIRKNADANALLALAELRVLDTQGNNIAVGRAVTSSGDQGYAWVRVQNVVDGATDTAPGIYISNSNDGWIRLDLGSVHNVGKIELIGRTDTNLAQNGQFTLYASTANIAGGSSHAQLLERSDVWRYREDSNNASITIDAANAPTSAPVALPQRQPVITQARYVYVRKMDGVAMPLAIAELQVLDAYGNNLAQGKPVSSSAANDAGWSANGNAVDGKSTSDPGIFLSAGSSADWLQVDLGQVYDIAQIKVVGRTDANLQQNGKFNVYAGTSSLAGTSNAVLDARNGLMRYRVAGNPVLAVVNAANPPEIIGRVADPAPATTPAIAEARYIYIRKNADGGNRLSFAEIQVFDVNGVNRALGKTVTSSGAYDTGWFKAENVVDGQTATEPGIFASSATANAWLQIDLGAVYRIGKIQVTGRADANQVQNGEYKLYASTTSLSGLTNAALAARTDVPRWVENSNSVHVTVDRLSLPSAADPLALIRGVAQDTDVRSRYFYDAAGRLAGEVDAEGYLTEYRYDLNGRLEQTVRFADKAKATGTTLNTLRPNLPALGRLVVQTWDLLNRVTLRTESQGTLATSGTGFALTSGASTVTRYAYDGVGNLLSATVADASSEARTQQRRYDLLGRVLSELSTPTPAQTEEIWANHAVRHAYDKAGRRTSTTDQNNARTLFFYNVDGQLTHTVNALGEVSESQYDALGQLTATVQYANRIGSTSLAALQQGGLPSAAALAILNGARAAGADSETTYAYNTVGALTRRTDAQGFAFNYVYNAFGQEVQRTQDLGGGRSTTSVTQYDRRGLATQVQQDQGGLGIVTQAEYDAFGRLVRSQDGNGRWSQTQYDRLGRAVVTLDPLNVRRSTSYDAFSRVLTLTNGVNDTTRYSYDPAERSMTVITPEGIAVKTVLNRHGQTQSVVDGNGNATTYEYDANGALIATNTALTRTVNRYDRAGRLVDAVDANGNTVRLEYDAANRITKRTVDSGRLNLATEYKYDARGRQIEVKDPNGTVTQFSFNRRGELQDKVVDLGGLALTTRYSYDGQGNTLTVTDPNNTVTAYTYDALGRRVLEVVDPATAPEAGLNLTRRYAYDANGNVTSMTDGNGHVTRYGYDANNRLRFSVDAAGSLRETVYDDEGRITKQIGYATPADRVTVNAMGLTLSETQFSQLRTSVPARDSVEHRVYDRDGRVRFTVDGIGAVVFYAYDNNGNVIRRTARAMTVPNWTPGTDPAPTPRASDQSTHTVYDALNRALYTIDGAGAVVAFTYDNNGNVTERLAYTKRLGSAALASLPDRPTATQMRHLVVYIRNLQLDQEVRYRYDGAGRVTFKADSAGSASQYLYDKNGNLQQETQFANVNASVADRWFDSGTTGHVDTVGGAGKRALYTLKADGSNDTLLGYIDTASVPGQNTALYLARKSPGGYVYLTEAADIGLVQADGWTVDPTPIGYIRTKPASGTTELIRANKGWTNTNTYVTSRQAIDELRMPPPSPSAADRVTRREYDKAGRLIAGVDATGAVTSYAYNRASQLIRQTQHENPLVGYASASAGSTLLSVSTPAASLGDRVTRHFVDRAGRTMYTVDAERAVTEFQYDGVGNLITQVQRKLTLTDAKIVTLDNQQSTQGTVSRTFFNAQAIATPAEDRVTRHYYDAAGRVLFTRDAENHLKGFTYDALGQLRTQTVFMAEQANDYFVDEGVAGYVSTSPAVGKMALYRLYRGNPNDHIYTTSETERQSLVQAGWTDEGITGYVHSNAQPGTAQLQRLKPPSGANYHYYTADPELVRFAKEQLGWVADGYAGYVDIAPSSNTVALRQFNEANTGHHFYTTNRLEIDINLALQPQVSTLDRKQEFKYDAAGNLVGHTNAEQQTESYIYDGLGQKLTFTNTKNSLWSYEYDASGFLTLETSPEVNLTSAADDVNGTLQVTSQQPARIQTKMEYDALGRLLSRTEALGRREARTTRYEYDGAGRQVKVNLPAVGVHAETPDGAMTNLNFGEAARTETPSTLLSTEVRYDALGNAVAGRDAQGNWSYKVYDDAGQVRYEIDAAGYITGYERTTWGEVKSLVRYAKRIENMPTGPSATGAFPSGLLDAVVLAVATDNRKIQSFYDRMGRLTEVLQPEALHVGNSAAEQAVGRSSVRNTYNAFGDLEQVNESLSATRWAKTSYVYDRLGQRTTITDALNYVTTQTFDAAGNLKRRVEYAEPGTVPSTTNKDRITEYTYDRLNRKKTEIRLNIDYSGAAVDANGAISLSSQRKNVGTSYTYDAVGNLTSTTESVDAQAIRTTYSYYDALGRVTAVVTPGANTGVAANGTAVVTALTEFRRDGLGNALVTTQRANGVVSANKDSYQAGAADATNDRETRTEYDARGNVRRNTDATGITRHYSYDARGLLAKEWQTVTLRPEDGSQPRLALLWTAYAYDTVGRRTHVYTATQNAAGTSALGDTATTYNAFGEVTDRVVDEIVKVGNTTQITRKSQERSDYDNAGRIWRTNAGDGVVKVFAYNMQGQKTVELVGSGAEAGNSANPLSLRHLGIDSTLKALSAQQTNPGAYRRTDMRYDDLGRLTQTLEPSRSHEQAMTISTRDNLLYGVISKNDAGPGAQVDLVWRSLEDLGSGDVRITLTYANSVLVNSDTWQNGSMTRSIVVSAEEALNGYSFRWKTNPKYELAEKITSIQQIKVEKLDISGQWATLYNVNAQPVQSTLQWSLEADLGYIWNEAGEGRVPIYRYYNKYSGVHMFSTNLGVREHLLNQQNGWLDEGISGYLSADGTGLVPLYRHYNETTGIQIYSRSAVVAGWVNAGVEGYVASQPGSPAGTVALRSLKNRASATGDAPLYTTIPSEITALLGVTLPAPVSRQLTLYAGSEGLSIEVSYPTDLISKTQLRWRVAGSGASYSTIPDAIFTRVQKAFGSAHRFDLAELGLAPGSYDYEIVNTGNGVTRQVGNGKFTINGPGVPDVQTFRPVQGTTTGLANIDGALYEVFKWPAQEPQWRTTFKYRPKGSTGAWTERTVTNGIYRDGDGHTASMGAGMQGVAINLGAGEFEYELRAFDTSTGAIKQSTGVLKSSQLPVPVNVNPAKTANNNVTNDGVVGYVWTTPGPGRMPLYQFYMPAQNRHITMGDQELVALFLNTMSYNDLQPVQGLSGNYDGIIGYVATSPSSTNKQLYQYNFGGRAIFRLTADSSDIGYFKRLADPDVGFDDGWGSAEPTTWYQNNRNSGNPATSDFDGYISTVPVEGTVALYALRDAKVKYTGTFDNASGPGSFGYDDFVTTTNVTDAMSSKYLNYTNLATKPVAGVTVAKALIDGLTYNVLQWPQPPAGSRVTVRVVPADERGEYPYVFRVGDTHSTQLAGGASQAIVLDSMRSSTTYTVSVQIEYPESAPGGAALARTDIQLSIPASGMVRTVAHTSTTTPFFEQTRAISTFQGSEARAEVAQTLDRWGNVLTLDDPRVDASGVHYKTTFKYNAYNQLTEQVRPQNMPGEAAARTVNHYDGLGRLVAAQDARGYVNAFAYDGAGNLVQEFHADKGRVDYGYNAFGDLTSKRESIDATASVTLSYEYDKMSRLKTTKVTNTNGLAARNYDVLSIGGTTEERPGANPTDAHNGVQWKVPGGTLATTVEYYYYDEAGRRTLVANDAGEATRYQYDAAGNVVSSGQETSAGGPLLYVHKYRHDAAGRKVWERDGNGLEQTWSYDTDGRLTDHTETLNAGTQNAKTINYQYRYNGAGQLLSKISWDGPTRRQDLHYRYDGAGQLVRIEDKHLGQVTTYTYDLAGNRLTEKLTQKTRMANGLLANVVYQDNHLFYDVQNRLRLSWDGRVRMEIGYDLNGNRKTVSTQVINQVHSEYNEGTTMLERANVSVTSYDYDAMNRQIYSRETRDNQEFEIHTYEYDRAGRRTRDVSDLKAVAGQTASYNTYQYKYDSLHRLVGYDQNGTANVQEYKYDAAGRTVYSKTQVKPQGDTFVEHRYNQYGVGSKLQTTFMVRRLADATGKRTQIDEIRYANVAAETGLGYDSAGNLLGYWQKQGSTTITTRYGYQFTDGQYLQNTSTVKRNSEAAVVSNTWRDANGFISNIGMADKYPDGRFDRAFVNDAQGRTLYVNQAAGHDASSGRIENPASGYTGGYIGNGTVPSVGRVQRQLIVNGEVLLRYGEAPDPTKVVNAGDPPAYTNTLEQYMDAGPLQARGTSQDRVSYTVVGGETLRSVARAVLGDGNLWYRIAEANGLALGADSALDEGTTLSIPRMGLTANNVDSLQPYDAGRVTGSLDAVLPAPGGQGGKCGGLGQILSLVVTLVLAANGVYVPLASVVGNVAGQVVSMATGEQSGFNWKSLAMTAASAGMAEGVTVLAQGSALGGSGVWATMGRAAIGNVATQGLGLVTGLQDSFSWRQVAASAAGSGVAHTIGEAFLGQAGSEAYSRYDDSGNLMPGASTFDGGRYFASNAANSMGLIGSRFVGGALTGLGASVAASVMRGGKVAIQQVAVDAFGNALGESLASASTGVQTAPAANIPFPDRDQVFQGSAASLPELAEMEALNRQLAANYEFDGADLSAGAPLADNWARDRSLNRVVSDAGSDMGSALPAGASSGFGLKVDPSKLPQFWTSDSVASRYAPNLGMKEVLDYLNPSTRWDGFKEGFSIGGVIDGIGQFLSDPLGSLEQGGLAMQERTRQYFEAGRRGDFGAAARFESELVGSEAAGLVVGLGAAKGVGLSLRAFNAVGGVTSDLISSSLAPYSSLRLGSAGLGDLSTGISPVWVNSLEIRQSQQSISFAKKDQFGSIKYTLDDIARGFSENPGDSRLVIDAVRMRDGGLTTLDNSRPAVLNAQGGGQIQVRIRSLDESLTQADIDRFTAKRPGGEIRTPSTWGEAVDYRIWKQGDQFMTRYPNGTGLVPKITGAPAGSSWSQYGQYPWMR